MADALELSPILKRFEDSFVDVSGLSGEADTLASNILGSTSNIDEAISNLRTAGNDSTINSAITNLNLAKDGLNRIKDHVSSDIPQIIAGIDAVMDIINEIKAAIVTYNTATANISSYQYQLTADPSSGNPPTAEKIQELNGKIEEETRTSDEAKKKVEGLNKKGEAQLAAVEAAANGISFGVAGNMHDGGVLGPSVSYSDNYNFSWQDPDLTAAGANGDTNGDTNGENADGGGAVDDTPARTLSTFDGANEGDELTLAAHTGDNKNICIPRNMREFKDAVRNGQPIILEMGSIFQYDPRGAGYNYYDATNERKYFVRCSDGNYREVDANGNLVNNEDQKIVPSRLYEAADYSTQTGWGTWGENNTGLKYAGPQREKGPGPVATGEEVTYLNDAKGGDIFKGTKPDGSKMHYGDSNVVAEPKTMVEFKEAVKNGQPIKLIGVNFVYDEGQAWFNNQYDASKNAIYLVQCEDGNYRSIDANTGKYINDQPISPKRIFEAGDETKSNWWTNAPWHWGTNDTFLEQK